MGNRYRNDYVWEDGYECDEPPVTRSERVGYVLATVLVVLSMALAVFV